MASDVQIANAALMKLGHTPIQSITLDSSDQALAVRSVYDICRDDTLVAHPWNFATRRAELAETITVVATDEWSHFYTIPTGCLRVLYIEPNGTRFQVENGLIMTNASAPINVAYIARITDSELFSPQFVGAFVYRLCMELAPTLTAREGFNNNFTQLYLAKLQEAKATDGQEGSPFLEDASPLGDVRRINSTIGPDHSGWPWW